MRWGVHTASSPFGGVHTASSPSWVGREDEDGLQREKQLLIDFLCHSAGGPLYYTGRNMILTHRGMNISQSDWDVFIGHLVATFEHFKLAKPEAGQVLGFIQSTKDEIVEG